jgi:GPI mannosyltransferase 3
MGSSASFYPQEKCVLGGISILAGLGIALRLYPVLIEPSVAWPDEIFQAVEPAHRLAYGSGLVPWEFQLGLRSWLLPGIIAGLMDFSRAIGDGPDYYLPLIAFSFAALATAPVVCCFLWCRLLFGTGAALIGGMVVAVAAELVYFGARTLSEVAAAHLLLLALYVLEPGYQVRSRRRLFWGGVLFGLVFAIRVQLAPTLMIIALWTNWRASRERVAAILTGACAMLAAAALLDAVTLGYPFASIWRDVSYNLFYGVSYTDGVHSWRYYLVGELGVWGAASATVLLLAVIGARRLPLLLIAAMSVVVVHSAIAHKEYRYIYPAILLVMVLAGVGLTEISIWVRDWLVSRRLPKAIAIASSTAFAAGWWCQTSFQIWSGETLSAYRQHMHDELAAASFVTRNLDPCGIGLYGLAGKDWQAYGGYTYFHRPAPMYWPRDEGELIAAADGFDTLLYTELPPARLAFTPLRCIGRVCIAQRRGECRAILPTPLGIPAVLAGTIPAETTGSMGSAGTTDAAHGQ